MAFLRTMKREPKALKARPVAHGNPAKWSSKGNALGAVTYRCRAMRLASSCECGERLRYRKGVIRKCHFSRMCRTLIKYGALELKDMECGRLLDKKCPT